MYCVIKSRTAKAKAAFKKNRALFTGKMDLELTKKLVKSYIWSVALYGAETWILQAIDQKHLEVLKCGTAEDQLDRSCKK
jgi:hypothetical protein